MSAADGERQFPLWHYVWKLLSLRFWLMVRGIVNAKPGRKVLYGLLGLFLLGVFVGVFAGSWALMGLINRPEVQQYGDFAAFQESIPALALGGAFVVILMTGFGVLLQSLYLSGDIDFLLAAPVPIRAVFVAKLTEAILPNLALISLFGLPILFGLGAANQYFFLYYPFVILMLVMLAAAAAGLASLLVMGVARFVPARRVAEVLGFFGAIFSMICTQSGQLLRFSDVDETQAVQSLSALSQFNSPWLPLAWPGRGLVALGEGNWLFALLFLGLSIALTGGLFMVALTTAERVYYNGWAQMQGVALRRGRRNRPAATAQDESRSEAGRNLLRWIPAQIRGIVYKDSLMFRRDLRSLSQLVTPVIFVVIYAVIFSRGGSGRFGSSGSLPDFRAAGEIFSQLAFYGSVALALFMGWSIGSRIAMIGFSQEGKQYWLLKTAPISTRNLLVSKFLVGYIPAVVIGWVLLMIMMIVQKGNPALLMFSLVAVAISMAGLLGITVAFGVAGVRLDWVNPQQMVNPGSGCLASIASMVYMGLSSVFLFGPPIAAELMGFEVWMGQLVALLLGGLLAAACAIVPPMLVLERVERIGEV